MENWRKLGNIFAPGKYEWMSSHAQNPLPEPLGGSLFKIHFATRDSQNRSRGGYAIIDITNPKEILEISSKPTLNLGELGTFDDSGVMPSSIVKADETHLMYYTGWSKTVDVPFAFHIGLATSADNNIFTRASRAPVLGRNHFDPFITGAPYVILENGCFRMWYISGTKWAKEPNSDKPRHFYTVKLAESSDGIAWKCGEQLCLEYRDDEYAIARPVVWKQSSSYKMWFTYRGGENTYRVGVADSDDGQVWNRSADSFGIEPSDSGWDSEMICYAHPIFIKDEQYAIYNGNGYGQTGFGLAVYT